MRDHGRPLPAARGNRRLATCLLLVLAPAVLPAQATAPIPDATDGWHVIRPGDTLEGLARRYLGSRDRWQEIYRLNPQIIDDPHWIFPGRRVRVRVDAPALPHAQIRTLARRVEERPAPVSWRNASSGDLLLENDGLRTYRGASAELRFEDGTAATLSEDSLVFVRRQGRTAGRALRREIEIELGQADLATGSAAGATTQEIEIIVSGAKNRATAIPGGRLATRSRRTATGAQFMQFEGSGEVTSGGSQVTLAAGTGTTVANQQPPQPPEPLLAAPTGLDPTDGDELGRDEPVLRWSAVPGADHYVVEVCGDAECGQLIERRADVAASPMRLAEPLPDGGGFWRVAAVAASGLDGFPSASQRFASVDSVHPPAPRLSLTTPAGAELRSGACVSDAPQLVVDSTDRRGHALPWSLLLNDSEVTADVGAAFTASGRYQVVARAVDERGREARSAPFDLTLDDVAPAIDLPPAMGGEPIASPEYARRLRLPRPGPEIAPCAVALEVATSTAGPWTAVACGGAETAPTRLALAGDAATLVIRSAEGTLRLGEWWPLDTGHGLEIALADRGCGLAEATVRIAPSPFVPGQAVLEIDVDDAAGLHSHRAWHVAPFGPR